MPDSCSAQSLASSATCFTCQPEKYLLGMQVYLLCQLLQQVDPMANCNVQALLNASACYRDCMTGKALYGAMVYLLCQLLENGGTGGGAIQVYTGAAPPAAPANPALPALYYPTGAGAIQEWDGGAWK